MFSSTQAFKTLSWVRVCAACSSAGNETAGSGGATGPGAGPASYAAPGSQPYSGVTLLPP